MKLDALGIDNGIDTDTSTDTDIDTGQPALSPRR